MRVRFVGVMLLCCLLLSGCASLLDREYSVMELHSSKYWESDSGDTLRAENYQDVVNDLLLLISEHTEQATLRLYDESGEMAVADILERAATEVQQETPMGAYAVEYITTESQLQRGYYEVTVRIGYRRTEEQVKAVVNATSTAALQNLLDDAMEDGRQELAVRIGYWNEEDTERVEEAAAAVQEKWGLTDVMYWAAEYYPANGDVGLIEFRLEVVPDTPPEDATGAGGTGEVQPDEGAGGNAGEPGTVSPDESAGETAALGEAGAESSEASRSPAGETPAGEILSGADASSGTAVPSAAS